MHAPGACWRRAYGQQFTSARTARPSQRAVVHRRCKVAFVTSATATSNGVHHIASIHPGLHSLNGHHASGTAVPPTPAPAPAPKQPTAAAPAPQAEWPWYENHRHKPAYRSVYDHAAWVEHRNPTRYFTQLMNTTKSYVLRNVVPAVMWVVFVSTAVATYCTMLGQGMLPAWAPAFDVAPVAQAFLSTTTMAMSLLLVFRTNQSYARWDEARKFWGATLNRSRDLARQAVTMFPEPSAQDKFLRWHVAFVRAMHRHFQNEGSLEADLKDVLPPEELQMLLGSQHRPMKALHVMGEILVRQAISPIHQFQVSLNLQHFHDQLGACERLLRTPIPVSYTRHTSRFLFLWLTVLPFSLWTTCGWGCVPLCALIAVSLLKIDEIGMQIEEPFGILPLDVIAGRIHTDVMSTLKDAPSVKAMVRDMVSPAPSVPVTQLKYAYN